jgi:hypothetical protein
MLRISIHLNLNSLYPTADSVQADRRLCPGLLMGGRRSKARNSSFEIANCISIDLPTNRDRRGSSAFRSGTVRRKDFHNAPGLSIARRFTRFVQLHRRLENPNDKSNCVTRCRSKPYLVKNISILSDSWSDSRQSRRRGDDGNRVNRPRLKSSKEVFCYGFSIRSRQQLGS